MSLEENKAVVHRWIEAENKKDLGLPFEREKIEEFSNLRPNERIGISGYVKWISNRMFALVPTLFSNQVHLLCRNNTDQRPNENSYITISGYSRWVKLRPHQLQEHSTLYEGQLLIEVDDWNNSSPNFRIPNTVLDFENFKSELTSRIEGLEPKIKDFLAFTTISTPMFNENIGGMNLTLYDSSKSGLPKLVIKELKRVIPTDIGDMNVVETSFGRFGMRYKYSYITEDADKPLSKTIEPFLIYRTSQHIPEYNEVSVSMFSAKERPMTIEDPPCSFSDIPTVVPEETSIVRTRRGIDQFDAFNFIIVNHMKAPVVENLDSSLASVANNLEKLSNSWGLDPIHLTRFGFLNANYNARPTSVIRNSLSYARANNINVLDANVISKVFDDYFRWNFDYVYEIWEDLLAKPITGGKPLMSLRVKYRDIIRVIRKNESNDVRGVSKEVKAQKSLKHTKYTNVNRRGRMLEE